MKLKKNPYLHGLGVLAKSKVIKLISLNDQKLKEDE